MSKYSNITFHGYRRENGRVGVRNHVVILPVDDISNAACEAVANNVKGTLAIPHAYGRLQFGEDLELHFRTICGEAIVGLARGERVEFDRSGACVRAPIDDAERRRLLIEDMGIHEAIVQRLPADTPTPPPP